MKKIKILVKRVDNLGDVIFILPVLRELKKIFPKADLVLMVKKAHRGILYGYADAFLPPRSDQWIKVHEAAFHKIVIVAYEIPPGYIPSSLFKQKYIHLGVRNFKGPQPVYHKLLTNLKTHGVPVSFLPPKLQVDLCFHNKALKLIGRWNSNGRLRVTVDPGSSFARKCWPLSYFTEVCRWLTKHRNAYLFILGAKHDTRIQKLVSNLDEDCVTWVTGKPIEFVASLMTTCDLHLGNDSGIGHLAAALNKPTVTIFGPTAPHLWRPSGGKAITVYNPDVECEGGYEHASTCKLQSCLKTVKPQSVADAIVASINLFVRPVNPVVSDAIKLSPHVVVSRTVEGVMLANSKTGHRCLIVRGWREIKPVIKSVDKIRSFTKAVQKFPSEQKLIEMLLVHRILIPAGSDEKGATL